MTAASQLGKLIEERTGLDASIIGALILKRALERRAEATASAPNAYLERLERGNDPAEWDELLDEIIIPESWFFRDTEPFRCLASFAQTRNASRAQPLRILSAPCAAGEEPYSAAITLLEAGLSTEQFCIEAIDISARMIARGREGVYGENAFRREGRELREKYFETFTPCRTAGQASSGTLLRIKSRPRGCVEFAQGNLLDATTLLGREPYDAIFCRNLLIYLKRPAREKLIAALARLLKPGGLLFVGHAEILHGLSEAFELAPHPRAYAYRLKAPAERDRSQLGSNGTAGQASSGTHLRAADHARRSSHTTKIVARGPASVLHKDTVLRAKPRSDGADVLLSAQRMADEGRLDEAREALQNHLADHAKNPGAWCLLGMVHESQGRAREAEECYQKALYLEADCYDALVHLAFLAEQRSDNTQAARLRQRAQRVLAEEGA
ncbi:MAG TPA: CheR family methyltransferase [Planctomycetota bacterium]|nr:CheR family methyltransferase [Planctomycetota bacterium]